MHKWEEFVGEAQALGPEAFSTRHPHPVLVLVAVDEQADTSHPDRFKTQVAQVSSLRTAIRNQATKSAGSEADDVVPATLGTVFTVAKRPGNAYPDRISIGRTKTNDVALTYPLISKFHAYITSSTTGEPSYSVTDAAATNGTSIDGNLLVSGITTPILAGSVLRLGPYSFSFLTPKAFRVRLLDSPTQQPRR